MSKYKIFFILLISSVQANATILTGNTEGVFNQNGTSIVKWGEPVILFSGFQSSIEFSGSSFSVNDGESFVIGRLTYTNGVIDPDSSFEKVINDNGFDIGVNFSAPAQEKIVFNYKVSLEETDNNSSYTADTLTLIAEDNIEPFFSLNGENYIFTLLGFKSDSGEESYDNFFVQSEASSSDIELAVYARLDSVSSVPLPSAAWLFISALSGFFILGKRRVA